MHKTERKWSNKNMMERKMIRATTTSRVSGTTTKVTTTRTGTGSTMMRTGKKVTRSGTTRTKAGTMSTGNGMITQKVTAQRDGTTNTESGTTVTAVGRKVGTTRLRLKKVSPKLLSTTTKLTMKMLSLAPALAKEWSA